MIVKIKSKKYHSNKILANWKKEGTLENEKVILNKVPKKCINCNSENISYWDETDEEIIFQCIKCKRYYPIPFNQDNTRFYFTF